MRTRSIANIVMLDVFHHLPQPATFLDEAASSARTGWQGRDAGAVLLAGSRPSRTAPAPRAARPRRRTVLPSASVRSARREHRADDARVLPAARRVRRRWPELPVVEERLLSLFVYPLSGGFSKRPLLPAALYRPLTAVERALSPRWGESPRSASRSCSSAGVGRRPRSSRRSLVAGRSSPRSSESDGADQPGRASLGCRNSNGSHTSTTSPAPRTRRAASPARNAVSCGVTCRARRTTSNVSLRPDLRVRDVRLAEREAAAGPQQREGLGEVRVEIDVVQDADADDRVELAPLEAFAGLDVPDHDSRAVADPLSGERGGLLAQVDATSSQPDSSRRVVNSPVPQPSSRQRTPGPRRAC